MEYMVVGKELDIAYIENHVQRKLLACLFKDSNGAFLCFGKRRDLTRVRETGQRTDKVGIESIFARVSLRL